MTIRWKSPYSLSAFRFLLLLLSLLATSCGDSRLKKVYPVKGSVLVDGKPAEGVTVRFISLDDPDDELARPSATTDADGCFNVTTYKSEDGMPAGSYAVSIVWFPKDDFARGRAPVGDGPGRPKVLPGRPNKRLNKVPAHYGKAETSGIKVQIVKGENVLSPFELEKKK